MKTNKKRTGEKDWRKADVRVLGQILAAQNIEFVLPDTIHLAEFFAEILVTIPGVTACRVCLEDVSVQKGEMGLGICAECQASLKRDVGQDEQHLHEPDFKCGLAKQPGIQFDLVTSLHHHFGFFVFQIGDPEAYKLYKPFIGNLANYVAISLENRQQKDLLQKAHDELERRVVERTQDLAMINVHLQEEIENRQQAEEALKISEKQIKLLIEDSPIAMVVSLGVEERVELVNAKFTELFGYTLADMPDAEHWWPLAYPDEEYRENIKTQWQVKVEQAIREKSQIDPMEATVRCQDGSPRYVEFRLSSIGPKQLITFVDLTERKQAEEALQERERHSQSLLRLSRNLEQAQTYTEVLNAALEEVRNIVGYQTLVAYLLTEDKKYFKALVAGGPIADTVMSEAGTATVTIKGDRMMEEIAEAKEIVVVEDAQTDERVNKEIVTRFGFRTIVNVPIILFDRHLGSVGMCTYGDEGVRIPSRSEQKYLIALASHMAVSLDRIHLFNKQGQAEQALRESEARYRTLVEQASDGIFLADPDGNYLDVNPSVCAMLGYTRDEILNLKMRDLASAEDQTQTPLRLDELRAGKNAISERRLITKSGALLPVEINGKVLDNGNFLGFARDITARQQADEKIKQHLDELERWYNLTLNREERVQELKREVNQLSARLGEPAHYADQSG